MTIEMLTESLAIFLDSNNKSNYVFNNIVPASYKFRVQTVATNGKTSGWVQRTLNFLILPQYLGKGSSSRIKLLHTKKVVY